MADSDLQELEKCYEASRLAKSILYASTALFLYDYVLTWGREVLYLWSQKKRITPASILFIFARYCALASAVISIFSASLVVESILTYVQVITVVASELIVSVRTWAIWERSRKILILLVCGTIVASVPALYVTLGGIARSSISSTTVSSASNPCRYIVSTLLTHEYVIPYLMIISYEIFNLSLSCFKIVRYRRSVPSRMRSPLLGVLWRDGVLYFAFMSLLGIMNIALVVQGSNPQVRFGGSQLQTCLHSVLSIRTLLHLSESLTGDPIRGPSPSIQSGIMFTSVKSMGSDASSSTERQSSVDTDP